MIQCKIIDCQTAEDAELDFNRFINDNSITVSQIEYLKTSYDNNHYIIWIFYQSLNFAQNQDLQDYMQELLTDHAFLNPNVQFERMS